MIKGNFMEMSLPVQQNCFALKFLNRDGVIELFGITANVTSVTDESAHLNVNIRLDMRSLALKDIAILKSRAADYIMLLHITRPGVDANSAIAYEGLDIRCDAMAGLRWDYQSTETQQVTLRIRYNVRRVLSHDVIQWICHKF